MRQKLDINLKQCELMFEDNKVIVIEHTKDEDLQFDLIEDIFKKFKGQTFNITLSTSKDL
ncbi:hypothetical protein [Paraclostridium sordellii]|uniref:hypothetical protein n=1 Tax=Paraclostridium sordellii TaxID=1505 RepID=UPI0022E0AF99|nr:hypothetical protein [Paeniclostridium sordellii]